MAVSLALWCPCCAVGTFVWRSPFVVASMEASAWVVAVVIAAVALRWLAGSAAGRGQ